MVWSWSLFGFWFAVDLGFCPGHASDHGLDLGLGLVLVFVLVWSCSVPCSWSAHCLCHSLDIGLGVCFGFVLVFVLVLVFDSVGLVGVERGSKEILNMMYQTNIRSVSSSGFMA